MPGIYHVSTKKGVYVSGCVYAFYISKEDKKITLKNNKKNNVKLNNKWDHLWHIKPWY